MLAAYLPWLMTLASVLAVWRAKPGLLLLTGNSLLESGIKLAYWVFSFFYGEAIPVWMLPVTALLAIPVRGCCGRGASSRELGAARRCHGRDRIRRRGGLGFLRVRSRRGCCSCCRWRCSRSQLVRTPLRAREP